MVLTEPWTLSLAPHKTREVIIIPAHRQESKMFKIIPSYIKSLKLAWATLLRWV